jgi:hypothetical protein
MLCRLKPAPTLHDHAGLAAGEREALARQVAGLETLEQVVRFCFAATPAWEIARVCVHDEFTHDVVVKGAKSWLVFDTT